MPLIYLSTMCEQPRTKDFVLLGSSQHKLIDPCYIMWILVLWNEEIIIAKEISAV